MKRLAVLALTFAAAPTWAQEQNGDLDDMRPAARALALAVRELPSGATLAEARLAARVSAARPDDTVMPATIRVWRRRVDGSTSSCSGRVDEIPFDEYVKGVLPHEWIPSWDARALEMGAVCVRTFAAFWVKAGGKYDCADLDDTTASQVYTDGTDSRTDAAVDRTAGVIIVRSGSLVSAEYSAENGTPTKFGAVDPYCEGKPVNGHGRGTCQWGTQRWATNEGKDYRWMTSHYYPGATVTGGGAGPAPPAMGAAVVDLDFPAQLTAGAEGRVTVEVSNTGTVAWDASVRLGTRAPSRFFKPGVWIDATRAVATGAVAPGASTSLTFAILAPEVTAAGDLDERFELVRDGATPEWVPGDAAAVRVHVVPRSTPTDPPPAAMDIDEGDATGGCQTGRGAGAAGALVLALLIALRARGAGRRGSR